MNESKEPLFCLADVAKALGYSRPADAVNQHCKGVVILPTPTNGGIQEMKFGKESEVYRLTMKSKLPDAVKFQDWIQRMSAKWTPLQRTKAIGQKWPLV